MLERLYLLLRQLYPVGDAPKSITPFLLTSLPWHSKSSTTLIGHREFQRESVWIAEHNGDIELGLYIDPEILERLETRREYWQLDDLACAIEGVSHFLYLVDRGLQRRSCSQLELELQAEIDKFLASHFVSLETQGSINPSLFEQLFHGHTYDESLSDEERDRYETAHHFAAKYCHRLRERYFFPFRLTELLEEVRPFFHKNLHQKLVDLLP